MARSFSITLGRPLGASLLLAGLLVIGLFAIAAAWADLSAVSDERDAKADLLERSVAASQRAARADTPGVVLANPFVSAESATLAAAKVEADLRLRTQAAGLALLSSRADAKPEQPASEAGFGTRIELQAIVEGQNEAMQDLLLALETGVPTVLVDNLALQPADVDQATPTDPQAPRLRMTLTLSAYWRPAKS